jgi:hypothetical protein
MKETAPAALFDASAVRFGAPPDGRRFRP